MMVPSEHVPCNLCGADDAAPVLTKHGFTIVRCRQCGLTYVTPRPTAAELVALYGNEGYYRNLNASPFGYPDYLGERWLLERLVVRRLAEIERRVGGRRRLLDVGCATGVLVEAAGAAISRPRICRAITSTSSFSTTRSSTWATQAARSTRSAGCSVRAG